MSGGKPFKGMRPGESLDEFHQRCVVPTSDEKTKRNADIDQFVRFLHAEVSHKPYTVAKVVKSGSLGKGTAVRGSADIDLVVFFNGLSSIEDLEASRKHLLDLLKEKVQSYGPWRGRIALQNRTIFSLCYTLDGQEIDILPACDIIKLLSGDDAGDSSDDDDDVDALERVYRSMASYHGGKVTAAMQYSPSLSPLQIEFVKPATEAVKKVIRLVKFWKKEHGLDVRSYTLELITIHVDKTDGSMSTQQLFRKVLGLLQDCSSLKIAFNDYYNSRDFIRTLRPPYVLDPANPYMNTLHGVSAHEVSEKARKTLTCI